MQCMMNCQPQNRKRRNKQLPVCRTESILHSSHALRCVAAYFFAKGADANEISFGYILMS